METRVQIAAHFTIDPAKQTAGAIAYPAQVSLTLSVGDQIEAKKVAFVEAFSPEQRAINSHHKTY